MIVNMARTDNNFSFDEERIYNLLRVLGAAKGVFNHLAKEHEHPNGIIACLYKNYATAADELCDDILAQNNANVAVTRELMAHEKVMLKGGIS